MRANAPDLDFQSMEHILAVEMQRIKNDDIRRTKDLQKMAAESDEIKKLKICIDQAMLNKERSA